MTTRALRKSDIPALRKMFERSGFEYVFPDLTGPLMETVVVIADENDQPIAAAAGERIIQLYLWLDETALGHPAAKMRCIRELHEEMAGKLRKKGYNSAEAFLPPNVAESFGRRLIRSFGWRPNWASFSRSF